MTLSKTLSNSAIGLAILSSIVASASWIDSRYATKREMQTVFVEVRLHQVDESMLNYQRLGLDTLNDIDSARYDLLNTSRGKLEEQRKTLLGLQ